MSARLQNLWTKLTSSLWFVPGLMAIGSLILAAIIQTLDARFDLDPDQVPLLYRGTADGAGSALSSLAGSMIGVTGVVFSITVVALSLASSQLGPRLLRNFMRDTSNQIVLGTFIGTFLFCLVGLQAVNRDLGMAGVPRLTVTVAFALAILSLAVLIYFIHHITVSMQADTVIANVGKELHAAMERLFPEAMGQPGGTFPRFGEPAGVAALVPAPRSGYLQAVDTDELLDLARRHDLILAMAYRPGQYVRVGSPLARVWPDSRMPEGTAKEIAETHILGDRRSAEQDIEFLIDQLVETASRALSPGINDPFTATACIDRLGDALALLARREFPRAAREDEDGALRVITRPVRFDELMDAAFDQVRQYGKTSVKVTLRVLDALSAVWDALPEGDARRACVAEHVRRVERTSHLAEHEASDRDTIDAKIAQIIGGA